MNDIIYVDLCDLSKQKIVDGKPHEIQLFDTYFIYRMRFRANEPQEDESLPWKEELSSFETVCPRNGFAAIDRQWIEEEERWKITICIHGFGYLKVYFVDRAKCKEVFEKLKSYFLP